MIEKCKLPSANEQDWLRLNSDSQAYLQTNLADLILDPQRNEMLNIEAAGIHFDFSRTHLSGAAIEPLLRFAEAGGLTSWREALESGAVVNPTENQAALHHYYRLDDEHLQAAAKSHPEARTIIDSREKCEKLVEAIRDSRLKSSSAKPYRHLIHLGIGGSALGPKLVLESLGYGRESSFQAHFVANIDGHSLEPILKSCQADETLVIICSKTFTTLETLRNAQEVIEWMRSHGVSKPLEQFIAVTARPENARKFGIDNEKILDFPKSIGGRYSVWSAVGLPAMIVLGNEVFNRFIEGARQMDRHFFSSPFERNAPALAGLIDVWYRQCANLQTLAVFCYDQRLELLIPYCQQLYMESNGKDRDRQGAPLQHPSAPVLWGGVGTEVQHAVFQLMHQGSGLHLPDFIAVARPAHPMRTQHQHLLANLLAQTSALSSGRHQIDGRGESELDFVNSSRLFSGNRPSTTICLPELNPETLGALLAYYEHRTFVSGVLWGINVFDQMGVELGKEMAQSLFEHISADESEDAGNPALNSNLKLLKSLS